MKLIKFAPLALAVFSAAASADMFTANLYDVNNINQDVIDSRLSMSGPLFKDRKSTRLNSSHRT